MTKGTDGVCRELAAAYGEQDERTLALREAADLASGEAHGDRAAEWLSFVEHGERLMRAVGDDRWARALQAEARQLLESVADKPSADLVTQRRSTAERGAKVASMHRTGASVTEIASATGASHDEIRRIGKQVNQQERTMGNNLSESVTAVAQRQRILRAKAIGFGPDTIAKRENVTPTAVVRVLEQERRAALPPESPRRFSAKAREFAAAIWPSPGQVGEAEPGSAAGRLLEAIEDRRESAAVSSSLAGAFRDRGLNERTMRSLGFPTVADGAATSADDARGQAAFEREAFGGDPDRALVETPAERAAPRPGEASWRTAMRKAGVSGATLDALGGGHARGAA